ETEEIERLRQELEQAMQHPLAGAGLEQIGMGPTVSEEKVGQTRRIADAIELRQIEADRATIMLKQAGLTADQREALQLQIIAAERLLAIQQAQGDAEKKDLADLRAEVETVALLREHLERTDA